MKVRLAAAGSHGPALRYRWQQPGRVGKARPLGGLPIPAAVLSGFGLAGPGPGPAGASEVPTELGFSSPSLSRSRGQAGP